MVTRAPWFLSLLLASVCSGVQADLNDLWSSVTSVFSGGDPRASYTARHHTYGFDVRDRGFYKKIVGQSGETAAGTLSDAQTLPTCSLLSSNSTNDATATSIANGYWYTDEQGYFWWEPAKCKLRRLTGPQARRCLAGRHIVFVGDSLTRYGYLNFVDFLSSNKYMLAYGNGPQPSLNSEQEFNSWDRFFKEGPMRLAQEAANATVHETCDCRHGMVGPFHTANYEDRQFVLEEQGLQPALRSLGLRLFEGDAAASGSTVRVSYYLVYSSPTVEEAGTAALSHALQHLTATSTEPSALIMNMGIWTREGRSLDDARQVFRRILQHGADVKAAHQLKTRLLWKTTSASMKNNNEESDWGQLSNMVAELTKEVYPWGLLDVRGMTTNAMRQGLDFYSFDQVHFHPVMYEQFNDLLLNMLCNRHGIFQHLHN